MKFAIALFIASSFAMFSADAASTHPMGKACSGSDPSLCRLTVSGIRADEADPKHSPITISVEKQNGLHISGDSPFTVEFVSDDQGPYPFYRPVSEKSSQVFVTGPARPEAANHKYHLVIHDALGLSDPHIVICGLC